MASEEQTESALLQEAMGKSRTEIQAYLKKGGVKATGTNGVLQQNFILLRKVELGLATAEEEAQLPTKAAAPKKGKKKVELPPEEKKLKDDAKKGWQYSDAKAALKAAIMGGEVPREADPDEDEGDLLIYFNCRPEVFNYGGFELFKSRLNDLRDQIRNEITRADEDEEAFMMFAKNHPKVYDTGRGYPEWEGHKAQEMLKKDMAAGEHQKKKPLKLWITRDCFLEFPLKVFREHIYQEIRTDKYLNYVKATGKSGEKWKDYRDPKTETIGSSSSEEEEETN